MHKQKFKALFKHNCRTSSCALTHLRNTHERPFTKEAPIHPEVKFVNAVTAGGSVKFLPVV